MFPAISNPVTGERMVTRQSPNGQNGYSSIVDLYAAPGATVNGVHVHPSFTETFTLLKGQLEMDIDGSQREADLGVPVVVPPGTPHAWWNAGDEQARVLVQASPDPDDRLSLMLSVLFALAGLGELDQDGMPTQRLLDAFLDRYKDAIVYTNVDYSQLSPAPEAVPLLSNLEKQDPHMVDHLEPLPGHTGRLRLAEYYNFETHMTREGR